MSSVVSHWYFYGPPSSDEEQARGERGEGALSSSSHEDDGDDDTERGSETQSDIIGDATMPGEYEEHNDSSHDDAQLAHRNPTASDLVRASFLRATGPSLGTVLLSALLLAFSRLLVLISSQILDSVPERIRRASSASIGYFYGKEDITASM